MKTEITQSKPIKLNKPKGRFNSLNELLDFKLSIANKLLSQIDPKDIENLRK